MGFSFLKTGAASVEAAVQAEAIAEKKKEEQGKLFRFWLEKGEEARITFVDGALVNMEGVMTLCPPRFFEHSLWDNATKRNSTFICPVLNNPQGIDNCPLCEQGDNATLLALFTVIDHRNYVSKDKKKTYTNTRKILAAKPKSFELLNKLAAKSGGLMNGTFDFSRSKDEKSPQVGDQFFFIERKELAQLQLAYTMPDPHDKDKKKEVTAFFPADYENEFVFRTGDEIRALGYGKGAVTGQAAGFGPKSAPVSDKDYSSQL